MGLCLQLAVEALLPAQHAALQGEHEAVDHEADDTDQDHANHKLVGECKGRNWYSTGSYCPLRWEPCPITIAEARADYLAWWRGLDQLARSLAGQLEKFHPLRPGTSEMPWLWFSPAKTAASCGFT